MKNPNGSTGKKLALLFALNEIGFKEFPEFAKEKSTIKIMTGMNQQTGEKIYQDIEDEFYQVINSEIEVNDDFKQKIATLFYNAEGCYAYISDEDNFKGEDEIFFTEICSLKGKNVQKLLQYFNYNW